MNQLKVHEQQAIIALHQRGWSNRRIARELGIHRGTVNQYLASPDSKPAISPPGSAEPISPTPATGSRAGGVLLPGAAAGRKSLCEPFATQIHVALEAGLSAQRIYQDLVQEHHFQGSYDAVKRFARRLGHSRPLPFRRIETAPGQQAQIDFGQAAWIQADGKRTRPHLFRIVLSFSRKGYSEVVRHQDTESFLRCLENSFRCFGGVPTELVIDNLRAAVHRADWFDPQLSPKVAEFCRHYGSVILPCRPAMPRHKGKVESEVKYAQNNALRGRSFESIAAQNQFLAEWETRVADTRIHGTTRQQVAARFAQEKPHLAPLPTSLFPVFEEAQRTVHRDGHIELKRAYYSVPPEYVGRPVWVRWELRLVRIFNHRMEPIALHTRAERGRFQTDPAHIHDHKRALIERGADWLLDRAGLIGPHTAAWAQAMMKNRGVAGLRVLQGLLCLAESHPSRALETACARALPLAAWHLRELKDLLAAPSPQPHFPFLDQHPIIRNLADYQAILPDCFANDESTQPHPTAQNP